MTMLALASLLLLFPSNDAPQKPPPPQGAYPAPRPDDVYNFWLQFLARNVDDAEPADEQFGWGIEFDGYDPRDVCGWELGLSRTSDEESVGIGKLEVTVKEVHAGARKTWGELGELHPYVSLGLSWVDADADVSGVGSEDDSSFGLYARGGAYWTFGEHFNVGADVKALVGTDIDFGDADYFQLGFNLGYSF